ncbi:MAG: redoxin domain-containing protein [Armatimonadetes bacterium]|nr:redoxin domain-containing protein [Armatimonadota bacterium]
MPDMWKPILDPKNALPDFALRTSDGRLIRRSDYRHKKPLALACLIEPQADPVLRLLRQHYPSCQEIGAEVLAIVREPAAAGMPFPVLLDADGSVIRKLGAEGQPVLIVADRFGIEASRLVLNPDNASETIQEAVRWLYFVEIQCPECGVAEAVPED